MLYKSMIGSLGFVRKKKAKIERKKKGESSIKREDFSFFLLFSV